MTLEFRGALGDASGRSPCVRDLCNCYFLRLHCFSRNKRLLKHIPSEIVGVYIAINGMLAANPKYPNWLGWVIFVALLALCPLWLRFGQDVRKVWQLVMSTIAFVIWAMTVPGAFDVVPYAATIGGALIIIYSG